MVQITVTLVHVRTVRRVRTRVMIMPAIAQQASPGRIVVSIYNN